MTTKSDQQIIKQICFPLNFESNSTDCENQIRANKLSIEWKRDLIKFDRIIDCTMDECDLGFYIYSGSNFTVQSLMNIYNS
jgi:hypothetical protein